MSRKILLMTLIFSFSFAVGFYTANNNIDENVVFNSVKKTECPFLNKYQVNANLKGCPYLELNNSVQYSGTCPYGNNNSHKNIGGKKENVFKHKSS